jgi:2-oxoglutarate/2-oxoacid ferredoxin oxidoreductase subunit alpha
MKHDAVNVVIGGAAGQGLVTLGNMLTKALVRSGYSVVVTQSYQSRIRGGHNTYAIRVSTADVPAPQEAIDILVSLDADTVDLHEPELSLRGVVVVDADLGRPGRPYLLVPFKDLAAGKFANVVALGVIGELLGLDLQRVAGLLDELFEKKGEDVKKANRESLTQGFTWMAERPEVFPKLPPAEPTGPRLTLNGNEAIALGALSAGVKFCSFYPMTPGTSVAISLAASAQRMGIVVEQAEDEIAAINMALGASFAGAPAMVTTSGGGFALMIEGVSLSAMIETPVVVVVAQRPGPATGLPTRTEQGDLEFVLHAGHGEFPRAIFAPGTVEECFYLTRKAVEIAHEFNGPAFVLTDQFLADSYRSVEPFPLEDLAAVNPCQTQAQSDDSFLTYAITESGVSPRLLPGVPAQCRAGDRCEHLVVADSDEHTEDGHLTEDLSIRGPMVEKRLRKLEGIRAKAVPPEVTGDENPDVLFVCWGSTKGAVLEAATRIREQGRTVGTVHLSQVWPLPSEQLNEILGTSAHVVCVEGNATGQMARLIRRETGFHIEERVLRYDGLPITPEFIVRAIDVL